MNILDWSGENRSVGVASIDKITFTEDDLVMNYNNGNVESLDMLSIRKITFSGSPLGIADVIGTAKANKIAVFFHSENQLLINNLPDGKHQLSIYSITGVLVHRSVVDSGSPAVPVNGIGKGVYIAVINNQTVKFVMP
ncbi:MAG: T9SS type A sorting domain-containing protein [Flavobacteriaceae bacterium]|nr:T9SS type A sorting domain-containing protein [Flavobacteriaceae bacterium]